LVLACQCGGDANPLNLCCTTGPGHASPQHPMAQNAYAWGCLAGRK